MQQQYILRQIGLYTMTFCRHCIYLYIPQVCECSNISHNNLEHTHTQGLQCIRIKHGMVSTQQNVRLCVFTSSALLVSNVVYSQLRILSLVHLFSAQLYCILFILFSLIRKHQKTSILPSKFGSSLEKVRYKSNVFWIKQNLKG